MRNAFYSEELNRMYEGLDLNEYVVGTYLVGAEPNEDPIIKAASIAIEQTTGSWADIPEETPELREKYAAKTIGIYEVPDYENVMNLRGVETRWFILRIASVSYTHLDVYKRQVQTLFASGVCLRRYSRCFRKHSPTEHPYSRGRRLLLSMLTER